MKIAGVIVLVVIAVSAVLLLFGAGDVPEVSATRAERGHDDGAPEPSMPRPPERPSPTPRQVPAEDPLAEGRWDESSRDESLLAEEPRDETPLEEPRYTEELSDDGTTVLVRLPDHRSRWSEAVTAAVLPEDVLPEDVEVNPETGAIEVVRPFAPIAPGEEPLLAEPPTDGGDLEVEILEETGQLRVINPPGEATPSH